MEQDEKQAIKSKFGEINYKGLEQLQDSYDTCDIDDSINQLSAVIIDLKAILNDMKQLKDGADELINNYSHCCFKPFSLDECGDIGYFADDICSELDSAVDSIEKVRNNVAPMQRLIPTDDGEVYIDSWDKLDEKICEDEFYD